MSEPSLTLVDFSAWNNGTAPERKAIADKLFQACRDVGFCYITNHDISPTHLAQAYDWSKKLFDLKQEEKMLAPHPDGHAIDRGYSWPGLEKVPSMTGDGEEDGDDVRKEPIQVSDIKESYEVGSEHNADQPNQWYPEHILPGFRDFMNEFYWSCHWTARKFLAAMALGIGLDEDYFAESHPGHNNQLRLLHYPPVPAAQIESQTSTRMGAHSDWGSITMLFQDECGGLQIENPHKRGDFIDVPALKDALIMNVGDLMMRWTNDTLKSTVHRVTLPPRQDRFTGDSRLTRARYSIPYFVSPKPETMVDCLSACTDGTHPAKYGTIKWNDYMLEKASLYYPSRESEAMA